MSGTVSSSTSSSSTNSAVTGNALQQLSSNFNSFLDMLMTQLQNQDPTNPMDSSQFTTELVQFSGVQQQVQTNTNLSQLIALQQGTDMMNSSSLVGQQVQATSSQIALQNGTGEISFNTSSAEPITIQITNAAGQTIRTVSATSSPGTNTWTWDGTTDRGTSEPDGAYNIAVTTSNAAGASTIVPFTVLGTATGVAKGTGSSGVNIDLGALSIDMSSVQAIGKASTAAATASSS
jgi:flagellar basal-body rod modification protein FlgD